MQLRSLSCLWGAGWQVKQRNMYVYIYRYVYIKLIYYISIYYNNLVLFVFIYSSIYSMVIYTFSSVSCFITLLANFSVMISLDYSPPFPMFLLSASWSLCCFFAGCPSSYHVHASSCLSSSPLLPSQGWLASCSPPSPTYHFSQACSSQDYAASQRSPNWWRTTDLS